MITALAIAAVDLPTFGVAVDQPAALPLKVEGINARCDLRDRADKPVKLSFSWMDLVQSSDGSLLVRKNSSVEVSRPADIHLKIAVDTDNYFSRYYVKEFRDSRSPLWGGSVDIHFGKANEVVHNRDSKITKIFPSRTLEVFHGRWRSSGNKYFVRIRTSDFIESSGFCDVLPNASSSQSKVQ